MQNKHIEHFEDLFLDNDMLFLNLGFAKRITLLKEQSIGGLLNISEKYDGSISIFIGKDENDYFVATKSIFNKTPILYKSIKDIEKSGKHYANKLIQVFNNFKHVNIPRCYMIQGDVLWTNKNEKTISDDCFLVKPNIIEYKFNKKNDRDLGVVWHTYYYKEKEECDKVVVQFLKESIMEKSMAHSIFPDISECLYDKIDDDVLKELEKIINLCKRCKNVLNPLIISEMKKYINTFIRNETSPKPSHEGFINFIKVRFNLIENKLKTKNGRLNKAKIHNQIKQEIDNNKLVIENRFLNWLLMYRFKKILLTEVNNIINSDNQSFINNKKISNEGIVITDSYTKAKFVDRLEFSYNNFLKNG